ncbi:MAG: hypothetical protein HZA46_04920 [Planctomycetales bacterium]|nr:hypothetical protein [Planctomycetales bacterium]
MNAEAVFALLQVGGNVAFFVAIAGVAVVLLASLILGFSRRHQFGGKIVAIAAGLLLLLLLAFVLFVLFVAESARSGSPL